MFEKCPCISSLKVDFISVQQSSLKWNWKFWKQKFQLRKYQITIYSRSRRVDIPLVSLKMFQKTVRFQSNHPRESFKNVPTCGLVRVVQLTFGNLVGTALLVLVLRSFLISVDSKSDSQFGNTFLVDRNSRDGRKTSQFFQCPANK